MYFRAWHYYKYSNEITKLASNKPTYYSICHIHAHNSNNNNNNNNKTIWTAIRIITTITLRIYFVFSYIESEQQKSQQVE